MDEDVLPVLHDFYNELYANNDIFSSSKIEAFIRSLDLPELTAQMVTGPILPSEIAKASKAPSSDGITTGFYKKFVAEIVLLLANVFNEAFDEKALSASQRLAIIVLLFKNGDPLDTENYRPISLMNVDYKILAYVLINRLKSGLEQLIHPSQMAYMSGHYIGTNICKMQDAVD